MEVTILKQGSQLILSKPDPLPNTNRPDTSYPDQFYLKLEAYLANKILFMMGVNLVKPATDSLPVGIPAEGVFEPEIHMFTKIEACVEEGP